MSFTPEEKLAYWKKRGLDHLTSGYDQFVMNYKRSLDEAAHAGFNIAPVLVAATRLEESVKMLFQEFTDMKKFEPKSDSKPFQESMKVQENVQIELATPAETHETVEEPVSSN